MINKEIQRSQAEIKEKYGDKLAEAMERLCRVCRFRILGSVTDEVAGCVKGLLPLCMGGEDCPYLIRNEESG